MSINAIATQIKLGSAESEAPNRAETLRNLAAQFESLLLSQMLRDMQEETQKSADGSGFGAPLTETMYAELANALVGAGGVGLATSIQDALARTTPGGQPGTDADMGAAPVALPRPYTPWVPDAAAAPSFSLNADRISSAYGVRRDPITGDQRAHKGIDIPLATGDDVLSVKAGVVVESGVRNGYGNTIVVDHGNGVTTRYAHLSARDVAVGDSVGAGQRLGLAGQTGRATGPHLHLEVRRNGVAIDPLGFEASQVLGTRLTTETTPTETMANAADSSHGASR